MTGMYRLAVVCAAIVGCVGAWSQDGKTIRVGFVCPFTGPSADSGNSARLGAKLAVAEINQVGGYLGSKIELLARDDEGKPDVGRAIAEEFVLKDKVDFTIGYCNTGVAMKSLDVYQSNQHLLMVPVSTGSSITELTQHYPVTATQYVNEVIDKLGSTVGTAALAQYPIANYGAANIADPEPPTVHWHPT